MFPWLSGVLCAGRRRPLVGKSGCLSLPCAELLGRVSLIPSSVCRATKAGANTVHKARAFMARFILALQVAAFGALAWSMHGFRIACAGLRDQAAECVTVLSFAHAWDETKQMLREPPRGMARRSTQKIAREILVQRGTLHALACVRHGDGRKVEHLRAETIIVPPVELYGKSAAYILGGLRRGSLFPLFDRAALGRLAQTVTAVTFSFWGDAAKSNRRALKHMVAVAEAEAWPEQIILDVGQVCMLHQVHRIKIGLIEVHGMVSLLYCMSKLVKAGAILNKLADFIGNWVERCCKRVVQQPPAHAAAQSKAVLDRIFRLEAAHHLRHTPKGPRKSRLLEDVEELLRLDNSGATDDEQLTHFCWTEQGRPCCPNREATVQRLTAAYLNLFVGHSMPIATLSRWTNVLTVCGMLCAGYACHNVYSRALVNALDEDAGAEEAVAAQGAAAAAGAGEDDVAKEHRARKSKVKAWLDLAGTRLQLACVFMMLQVVDRVTYMFMGGETEADAPHKKPAHPRPEQVLSITVIIVQVRQAMVDLGKLLREYGREDSESWRFLRSVGVSAETIVAEGTVRTFRRRMLGASVGLFRRLARRLHTFPLRLWVIADLGIADDLRRTCAAEFLRLPDCCLGVFGRGLRRNCPTVDVLCGTKGHAIIRGWLMSQHWSIYACEKEHASCRRLCGADGPGRNWTLLARERVVEAARSVHLHRTGVDPAAAPGAPRGKKRNAPETQEDGSDAAEATPLAAEVVDSQPPPLPWPEQSAFRPSRMLGGVGAAPALMDIEPSAGPLALPMPSSNSASAAGAAGGALALPAASAEARSVRCVFWLVGLLGWLRSVGLAFRSAQNRSYKKKETLNPHQRLFSHVSSFRSNWTKHLRLAKPSVNYIRLRIIGQTDL